MSAPEVENIKSDVYEQTLLDRREEERIEREHLNRLFNEEMDLLSDEVFRILDERGIPFEDEEDVEQALDAVMSRGPLDLELDSSYVRRVRESIISDDDNTIFWDQLQTQIEAYASLRKQSPYWRDLHNES